MEFKLAALKGHIPDSVVSQIPDTAVKFNITTPLRLSHFLAQCGHESGGFKALVENLNYGSKGLLGTFPKYFNLTTATQYERKPEMIASKEVEWAMVLSQLKMGGNLEVEDIFN